MLDWDHLQTFLAIARHGNLSAAARAQQVTQSTMGRRLDALHVQAGARLIQKTPTGFVLTPAGERVLASVERMEIEALAVERAISGEDERVAGEVRITTVDTFGARVITPLLRSLLEKQPNIEIEMITDNRSLSLSRREADIAIRLAEFEQHETVVRHVADLAFGLYASREYLERAGAPAWTEGAVGHTLVALQQDLALMPEAVRLAKIAPRGDVAMRANSRDVQVEAVRAGYGLGLLPCYLARPCDDLVEIAMPGGRVVRGIWLGVHRDTRHVRRIRLVVDHITKEIKNLVDRLAPPPS
jgi:DNA-binding transcriptional LysR family regulator